MRRLRRTSLLLLLSAAIAQTAFADTVRLKNGRAYEGVIAEHTPKGVRIQLSFGQLVIPADQVAALEKSPSALAGYLGRKAELQARLEAKPSDWLELARWAKANDLATSSRESALMAAELDPRLPGLDALLRPLGLVFEERLARWIPFEEAMARRGLVRDGGEWVSVQEHRARVEERDRRRAVLVQEAMSRRLAAAAEAMQRSEMYRLAEREAMLREAEQRSAMYVPMVTFPGFWIPPVVVVVPPSPHDPTHPRPPHMRHHPRHSYGRLQSRQAGTFLPAAGTPVVPPEVVTPQPPRPIANGTGGG
jgi:hypothetical protein